MDCVKSVTSKFLYNTKDPNYESILADLIESKFKAIGL